MLRSLLKVLKSSSSLNHQCGWVGFLSLQNKVKLQKNLKKKKLKNSLFYLSMNQIKTLQSKKRS